MEESELRSVPLFESLSSDQRRVMAPHAEIEVPEGTELVRQGEFAYEFFVGKVVRNATVATTSPARVILMTGQALRSMATTNPEVADRITAVVEERCLAMLG